jgi:hypothetical protein
MNRPQPPSYPLYKGLQSPLVFRHFKGRFIYYGVGSLLGSLILTMILSALISLPAGMLSGLLVAGAGLGYVQARQGQGLHEKTIHKGIFILSTLL